MLTNGRRPSGANYRTSAIEIFYPEEDGVYFGVIDVPGSQEAHRVSDPELIKKLPKKSSKLTDELTEEEKDLKDSKEATSDYFNRFKLLHNDSKLIHDLKEKFIIENANIVIVVCNKLSASDQEMVYKTMKYYKEVVLNQMASGAANSTALVQKQLYIVHNFKMLSKIKDVRNQIHRDINLCFEVQESSMFNFDDGLSPEEREKYNNLLFRDQFSIVHLALAANGTEAGDYYNTRTLEFLKSKIRVTDCKAPFDMCNNFLKFCNEHLKKMLSRPITLKYNKDKTAFVKEESEDFQVDSLAWDSLGDFVPTSGQFQPRYAVTTYHINEGTVKIIVDVELLDCNFNDPSTPIEDGVYSLSLSGEKRVSPGGIQDDLKASKREFVNITREEGRFDLKIKLKESKDKKLESRDSQFEDGVLRCIFTFTQQIDNTFKVQRTRAA